MADAVPINSDIGGLSKFDPPGDKNSVGIRWTRWVRSFELFAEGKGVAQAAQNRALLLHTAGLEAQDISYT